MRNPKINKHSVHNNPPKNQHSSSQPCGRQMQTSHQPSGKTIAQTIHSSYLPHHRTIEHTHPLNTWPHSRKNTQYNQSEKKKPETQNTAHALSNSSINPQRCPTRKHPALKLWFPATIATPSHSVTLSTPLSFYFTNFINLCHLLSHHFFFFLGVVLQGWAGRSNENCFLTHISITVGAIGKSWSGPLLRTSSVSKLSPYSLLVSKHRAFIYFTTSPGLDD